jgi:WD40 repeat protein
LECQKRNHNRQNMVLAREVIDLISDSEDDSPRKAAISTLQSFVPRKEKAAPKGKRTTAPLASTPQPTNRTPVAQNTVAPTTAPGSTNGWSTIRADASIAEILSHGLQSAARIAGLISPQPQPQLAAVTHANSSSHYNGGSAPRKNDVGLGPLQKQSENVIEHKSSPMATQAREGRRTNGPLHEERERRFIQYHQKEAERKGAGLSSQKVEQAVDTKGGAVIPPSGRLVATTQRSALSSGRSNGTPSVHAQGRPPSGPETKRRKLEHEEDAHEIATGMSEARRLSAATISGRQQSVADDQENARTLSSRVAPPAMPPPSRVVRTHNNAHAVATSGRNGIDLTEPMEICIDDSQPLIIPNEVSSKQDSEDSVAKLVAHPPPSDDADAHDESDSPDEIPAKSMRAKLPSVRPTAHSSVATKASTMPKEDSALEVDLQVDLETRNVPQIMPKVFGVARKGKSNHGIPYSAEEDSLLVDLRENVGIAWDVMPKYFCGRTQGSLQVRYSSKLKNRSSAPAKPQFPGPRTSSLPRTEAVARPGYTAPSRRHPKLAQRNDGFVSWADIKAQRQEGRAACKSETPSASEDASMQIDGLGLDFAHPASLPRILRSRELGNTGRCNWSSTARLSVSDELQNYVLDTLGPRRYFHGASRDVTCVAWARDGNKFAAGAIAIDDERSMQYNRPNNLLLGDLEENSLRELPEHHVSRPVVSDSRNVNSLQAMQETQDARLFKTVAAVGFSEDSRALYSAGADGVVRMYDSSSGSCLSSLKQEAELALLTSNSRGLLASGSHRSDDGSISVIRTQSDRLETVCQFGPTRADVQSSLPIFPTALKWGIGMHSHLLLAGFASDSYDDDRLAAGEVFLWDSTADQKIDLPAARNVFDVAWNPFPTSGSSLFAVASAGSSKLNRSSIQCFAPNQGRASRVLQWDCPAFDINDLVYCPHDDNLIAAGATDGKVYVWDKRTAGRNQKPLHVLKHDKTKNVLDHNRDVEIADTGVRFLSWSATGNRLYSGSSDGTVKVWNPYRAKEDALVKDMATFNSAVMSGAFSPDYRDLLIGEDQGQLNVLGIDREARSVRPAKKFQYYPATAPVPTFDEDELAPARQLLASGQIEIRPMGALPVKQAVQGPGYKGPFLAPSDDHLSRIYAELQQAYRGREVAKASLLNNLQDPETEKAIEAANAQVSLCEEASKRALQNRKDYQSLLPAASLLQRKFHDSLCAYTTASGEGTIKSCELDCNYLPAAGDDDGEAPDNRRSEQRIPVLLRSRGRLSDTSDLTNEEIAEAGLTSTCSACMGPAAKSKRGLPVCERCTLVRSGLTARCEKCAAPVRPNLDERIQQNVCERCSFHCFRCGRIAAVSPTGDTITCKPCDMQWDAGVLGYEVKKKLDSPVEVRDHGHEQVIESLDERMGRLLGEDERERLAGGWKVALVDGPVGY